MLSSGVLSELLLRYMFPVTEESVLIYEDRMIMFACVLNIMWGIFLQVFPVCVSLRNNICLWASIFRRSVLIRSISLSRSYCVFLMNVSLSVLGFEFVHLYSSAASRLVWLLRSACYCVLVVRRFFLMHRAALLYDYASPVVFFFAYR